MRTNIPSFRLPEPRARGGDRLHHRHGGGPASGLAGDEPAEACSHRVSSTRCSSAAARRRARIWSCPAAATLTRSSAHPHRHRLARIGRLRSHQVDRRARADHRRRQHGDGLLPHVAAPRRQRREGDGAQAARLLQGLRLGAGGRRGRERRDRRQPLAEELRDRERQAHRHAVRQDGVRPRRAGRITAERIVGEEFFPCDDVILAIGQENAFPWIERDLGIEFDKWHVPKVDKVTFQSTRPERVLRRRCGVRTEEHHLGGRARPPGRDLDPQVLPAAAGAPSACRRC